MYSLAWPLVNMEKEFVSYEQAVALKELRFDEQCLAWHNSNRLFIDIDIYENYNSKTQYEYCCSIPLKQQVFRWFREKKLHNTFPSIIQTRNWATLYRIVEWHPGNDSTSIITSDYYDTYEEAENACIDKLIELAKQQDNGR
jgi:hypothetical protein